MAGPRRCLGRGGYRRYDESTASYLGDTAALLLDRYDGNPGIIRIDFPGYSGEDSVEAISWEEWLQKFEDGSLTLVYQETTAEGEQSNFNRLVKRD